MKIREKMPPDVTAPSATAGTVKIHLDDDVTRTTFETAQAAKREVEQWPAWKRGEDTNPITERMRDLAKRCGADPWAAVASGDAWEHWISDQDGMPVVHTHDGGATRRDMALDIADIAEMRRSMPVLVAALDRALRGSR